jgi:hypothetical protein
VKIITNKRLLISESHDNSNRCTPCRGKLDQHATRFSHSVHVWPLAIRISRGPYIETFHEVINSDGQSHYPREKGFRHNPQHDGWSIRGSILSFSPEPAIEAVVGKATLCWRQVTRLTGPIYQHVIDTFNTCSRGPTLSVHDWHRRRLQPLRCQLFTYHSPTFLTDGPPLFT